MKTFGLNSSPMDRVWINAPSKTRQIFTVLSTPPEASNVPSGEKRTVKVPKSLGAAMWPGKVRIMDRSVALRI